MLKKKLKLLLYLIAVGESFDYLYPSSGITLDTTKPELTFTVRGAEYKVVNNTYYANQHNSKQKGSFLCQHCLPNYFLIIIGK